MTDYDSYFEYLLKRKRLGLLYRNAWLYPRLCRRLQGRALDIGCGIGDMVRFRPNTVGVDVNPRAVEFCRGQGLEVYHMQPDRLPFAARTFNAVVLDNVLEHIEDPFPLLAEIHRVLSVGGTVILGVPGERGYTSDPDHKKHYAEQTLRQTLKAAGFTAREMLYQPFYSTLLDKYFRFYALYGVFQRA